MICKYHEEVTEAKLMKQTNESVTKYLLERYQTVHSQWQVWAVESAWSRLSQSWSQLSNPLWSYSTNYWMFKGSNSIRWWQRNPVLQSGCFTNYRESQLIFCLKINWKKVHEAVTNDNWTKNGMLCGLSAEHTEDPDCRITALFGNLKRNLDSRHRQFKSGPVVAQPAPLIPLARGRDSGGSRGRHFEDLFKESANQCLN